MKKSTKKSSKSGMINYDNVPIYKTSMNNKHWKIVQTARDEFKLFERRRGRSYVELKTYSRYRDARKWLKDNNPDLIVSYVPGVNFYCSSQLEPSQTHMSFGAK